MTISATIKNGSHFNHVTVSTESSQKSISIPAKHEGQGSVVNGGELLFLALATCFCNDIYREAFRRNMNVESVEVTVTGQFGKEGEPASDISYEAYVESPKSTPQQIRDLIAHVDKIAEVHNTLRKGVSVSLKM
jgi:organic hydroperoxide reductase OsmC/OhrA